MRALFNTLSKYALLRAILYVVLGVLMVVLPTAVMNVIVYILAVYIIVIGVIDLVGYFRHRGAAFLTFDLVGGILKIVLGVLMFVFTRQLIAILPIFYGALLIIGGVSSLIQAFSYGRAIGKTNILLVILDILIAVGGVLLIINPFTSAVILFQVFGVGVVVMGIADFIAFITYRKLGREKGGDNHG